MVLKKPIVTFLLTLLLLFLSCDDKTKNKVISDNNSYESSISNNTQFLENDGIKLLLPENFKRYSSAEYEVILKTLTKGKILDLEEKRLRHLRNIDGNHYIYFDKASKSTILVNTIPYTPILRKNATSILADITRDLIEICKISKQDFSKVTGKYSETPKAQIFKSIHKVFKHCTNKIERNNLTLRTHMKRLNRKTICYSIANLMLEACLRIYIWRKSVFV